MDADKLNEAAEKELANTFSADVLEYAVAKNVFKRGTQWLMTQPLSDRLTDEEKEKLKIEYAELLNAQRKARQDRDTFYGNILSAQRGIYESIFGKELFNEK